MAEAAARPTVSVFDVSSADEKKVGEVALPAVLTAPIRPDVVQIAHTNLAKNKRQAYAVRFDAGMDYAAESWGTGRAVSRIPRVPGGGTHRSGQGAFGNMCRGGRMFAPTRVWRKWHQRFPQGQRRYAVCSALAASAVPGIVMARGHRVDSVPELPLVVGGEGLAQIAKTKQAVAALKNFGLEQDIERVQASKKVRAGKGKMRNRRYARRRGPLLIHNESSPELERAFRNIEGLDICHVDRLNLLQLAPGGHVGRLVVWTQGAFERLDALYGTLDKKSELKTGFSLPRPKVSNADISRIINSHEVQSVLNPPKVQNTFVARKKNPLRNLGVMVKLNPYAEVARRADIKRTMQKKAKKQSKKEGSTKAARRAEFARMME